MWAHPGVSPRSVGVQGAAGLAPLVGALPVPELCSARHFARGDRSRFEPAANWLGDRERPLRELLNGKTPSSRD